MEVNREIIESRFSPQLVESYYEEKSKLPQESVTGYLKDWMVFVTAAFVGLASSQFGVLATIIGCLTTLSLVIPLRSYMKSKTRKKKIVRKATVDIEDFVDFNQERILESIKDKISNLAMNAKEQQRRMEEYIEQVTKIKKLMCDDPHACKVELNSSIQEIRNQYENHLAFYNELLDEIQQHEKLRSQVIQNSLDFKKQIMMNAAFEELTSIDNPRHIPEIPEALGIQTESGEYELLEHLTTDVSEAHQELRS